MKEKIDKQKLTTREALAYVAELKRERSILYFLTLSMRFLYYLFSSTYETLNE